MPEDKIPYWDFDAPNIPNELRDASAGALMASAFIELSLYTEGDFSKQCLSVAETQLKPFLRRNIWRSLAQIAILS